LIEKGNSANLPDLVRDMRARDERDTRRAVAPLVPAPDALMLDSTTMSIEQVVEAVIERHRASRI